MCSKSKTRDCTKNYILDEDKAKATGRQMQGQGDNKHTIDSDDEVGQALQTTNSLIAQTFVLESSRVYLLIQ